MNTTPRTWAKPLPNAWYLCAQAGMTLTEAAAHLGKSRSAGCEYAKRHGFSYAKAKWNSPSHVAHSTARLRQMQNDPKRNPLVLLSPKERAEYDELTKRHRYRRAEALVAVGRADLVQS